MREIQTKVQPTKFQPLTAQGVRNKEILKTATDLRGLRGCGEWPTEEPGLWVGFSRITLLSLQTLHTSKRILQWDLYQQ